MAYYSGSFSTYADLQTAIQNACTANGWTLTSGILSKGTMFLQLTNSGTSFLCAQGGTGQSGTTLTTPATFTRGFFNSTNLAWIFPATYEIHIFANEVYVVVNYNSDFYQFLCWGQSQTAGITGTGMYVTGSYCWNAGTIQYRGATMYISSQSNSVGAGNLSGLVAPFSQYPSSGPGGGSSDFHCTLDATGTWLTDASGSQLRAPSQYAGPVLNGQPNPFNGGTVLSPLKYMKPRPSGGWSTVCTVQNARFCRIDNFNPKDTLAYGPDQWRIYPWYRKNTDQRWGVDWSTGAVHSGTFGIAIKYTGT